MKIYRKHNCQAKHRTYRAMANCIWPRAIWVQDEGRYALLAWCGALSITLHPNFESAEHSKKWIDQVHCGHACVNRHEVIQLVLPGENDYIPPSSPPAPERRAKPSAKPSPPQPESCDHWHHGQRCGATPTRLYLTGWRCRHHTPAVLAGRPESAPFDNPEENR